MQRTNNRSQQTSGPGDERTAAAAPQFPPPLIMLGSPRSFTSLVCAMIGQHPEAYGLPELNLFVNPTIEDLVHDFAGYKQIQMHGLLRTVAQIYSGEQTLNSVDMARRWMVARLNRDTADVYQELCVRIAPLRVIDKSPAYSQRLEFLRRIDETFPDALYLHLTRNPITQGESIMNVASGAMAVLANSIDYTTNPPTIDPQISWLYTQKTILAFLETIPQSRSLRLRGEDVLGDPATYFKQICRWAGLSDDDRALEAMMHPEDSPYASLGPFGANLGNDINFLNSPAYREGQVRSPGLATPLSWRDDGVGFSPDLIKMANDLGYEM